MSTKVIGWCVLNDSEQPMGDGCGAVVIFSNYDEAVKANGHAIRPAIQPRTERVATGRGKRKQQDDV